MDFFKGCRFESWCNILHLTLFQHKVCNIIYCCFKSYGSECLWLLDMQISEVSLSATWQSTCITGYGGLLLSQLHVPHAVESKPGCVPVIKILPKRTWNVGHSLEWFERQNKDVGLEFMSVSIFFFLNAEIFLFEICVSKKVWKTGK